MHKVFTIDRTTSQAVNLCVEEQYTLAFGIEPVCDIDNARGFPVAEIDRVRIDLACWNSATVDLRNPGDMAGPGIELSDRWLLITRLAEITEKSDQATGARTGDAPPLLPCVPCIHAQHRSAIRSQVPRSGGRWPPESRSQPDHTGMLNAHQDNMHEMESTFSFRTFLMRQPVPEW